MSETIAEISPDYRLVAVEEGRQLFVADFGPPRDDAPVAIYEAGAFGVYADGYWVCQALREKGFHPIAYTRAGLYGSDPVPEGATPDPFWHADDLARLLDAIEVRCPVTLVGHSMGGLRLHAFVQSHPEKTAGLVFIDAVVPRQLGWPVRREMVRASAEMIRVCEGGVKLPPGRAILRLYPNNIRLAGRPRADKLASYASPAHFEGTRREILASTDKRLATRFAPLAGKPVAAFTATAVAAGWDPVITGLKGQGTYAECHPIKGTGHVALVAPSHAHLIADAAKRVRDNAAQG